MSRLIYNTGYDLNSVDCQRLGCKNLSVAARQNSQSKTHKLLILHSQIKMASSHSAFEVHEVLNAVANLKIHILFIYYTYKCIFYMNSVTKTFSNSFFPNI